MQQLAVTRKSKDKATITGKSQRCTSRPSSTKLLRTEPKQTLQSFPDEYHHRTNSKSKNKKKKKLHQQIKKSKAPSVKIIRSYPSERSIKSNQAGSHQQNKKQVLKPKYMQIVQRIFQKIDLFNSGWIDSLSINKWVDIKVLYFFGSIFHIIKTKKGKLTKYQFMYEAQKIFLRSSLGDISYFIETACKDTNLNQARVPEVPYTRGVAAVTQTVGSRKRIPPTLYDLNYEVDINTKQAVTPLFSDTCLRNFDINRPEVKGTPTTTKPSTLKRTFLNETELGHSFDNEIKSFEQESRVEHKLTFKNFDQQPHQENINQFAIESRRRLQESKLGRLKDRLDYFIQRNSEHLNVSQYVRHQNGF